MKEVAVLQRFIAFHETPQCSIGLRNLLHRGDFRPGAALPSPALPPDPCSELLAAGSSCLAGGVPDLPSPQLRAAAAGRRSPLRLQDRLYPERTRARNQRDDLRSAIWLPAAIRRVAPRSRVSLRSPGTRDRLAPCRARAKRSVPTCPHPDPRPQAACSTSAASVQLGWWRTRRVQSSEPHL